MGLDRYAPPQRGKYSWGAQQLRTITLKPESTFIDIFQKITIRAIITQMIITKSEPFTKEEIEKLKEQFDIYIKTVIDVERKVCSAGADRHFESEKILLEDGSKQFNLWGGGIDIETKIIDVIHLLMSDLWIKIRAMKFRIRN